MSVDAVTLLFALLAVAAQLAVLTAVVLGVAGRFSPAAARWRDELRAMVAPQALGLAAVVAGVATFGSLYLSEVAGFTPCRLCWVQRGFMYPLLPILGVAAWLRAHRITPVVVALAALGGSVSIWHILIERFPDTFETSTSCSPDSPCSLIWVEQFGYVTIPTMALSAFALIIVLVLAARRQAAGDEPPESAAALGSRRAPAR